MSSFVGFGVVVHQIAGQQDDVGLLLPHDGGELVKLPGAEQHAQMGVAGQRDAHGSAQRFADMDSGMADNGGIGVIQCQHVNAGQCGGRKYPQQAVQFFRLPEMQTGGGTLQQPDGSGHPADEHQ